MKIHPTSSIGPEVEVGPDVEIGPYCLIQGKVKIGRGCVIEGHVTLGSRHGIVELGENNHISPGAVIGGPPQDITYKGESTKLIIGSNNVFREFSTANIATSKGHGVTQIGDNGYFMAYTHIGHDCIVGNNVIIANDSHLGGHCEIGDNTVISALSGLVQFTKVGKFAFIAGNSKINKDILPFSRAEGNWGVIRATNKVGLMRKGFSKEDTANIHKAIRIIVKGSDTIDEGLERIKNECFPSPHIDYFVEFIKTSKRGIAVARGSKAEALSNDD